MGGRTTSMPDADVVVVGAGAVGLATAIGLCNLGIRVLVVDAAPELPEAPDGPAQLRVSALTRASEYILTNLGVWSALDPARLASFEDMRVWDSGNRAELHFAAADIGAGHLGTMVENSALVATLATTLRERHQERCAWHLGAAVDALHIDARGVLVRAGGAHINAAWIIGADGGNSRVRELADIPVETRDYEQSAVVANLRVATGHEATAWQRFLPGGPIALLPLAGDYASIVWSTTPEHAAQLIEMSPDAFNRAVAEAFEHRFGEVVWSGARGQFPLRRLRAVSYVRDRLALVGDAAHTIHPLAGQGLNLGLLDAAALAEVAGTAIQHSRDPHRLSVLRRYERWRKAHNVLTQNAMDVLRRVFAEQRVPLATARGIGLGAVNASGGVKRVLSRFASGLSGDLPVIARRTRP
ncbi:MAG: FAD-dependent monooxygenase [Pseudomonadota bacterium]